MRDHADAPAQRASGTAQVCTRCGNAKPLTQFPLRKARRSRKGARHRWCRECIADYQREYRAANRDRLRQHKLDYIRDAKAEGLAVLGDVCKCCGETERVFLTLDHIYGREPGDSVRGPRAWARARARNWEGYQVLCFNCNYAKHALGECPHQTQAKGAI